MSIVIDAINRLPTLKRTVSPNWAAFWGFLFGGIGLAIYFRSFIDLLFPVAVALGIGMGLNATSVNTSLGWWLGALISAIYGAIRAKTSNTQLEAELAA